MLGKVDSEICYTIVKYGISRPTMGTINMLCGNKCMVCRPGYTCA